MNNGETKKLCLDLLHCDQEDEVVSILKKAGYWDDREAWRFYGDNPSNRGAAGAQQAHSDAALVEKLVNSVDATLTNEALVKGIDPEGDDAPSSIRDAVIQFFEKNGDHSDKRAGSFSSWPEPKVTKISRNITICATGASATKGDPCFTISDKGEGQTPELFPHTFMTLSESNKKNIPFVQGAFSMGGTGVLRFCGDKKIQFVLSRRNPELLKSNSLFASDSHWGFSIVRRNSSVDREAAFYEYLAPNPSEHNNGKKTVLHFSAKSMPIFPEKNDAYIRHSEWGTAVKLYEYSCVGFSKSSIHRKGLTDRLQLRLPKPALPIRAYECRKDYGGEKTRSYEYNITGIIHRIEESRKKENNLEIKIAFPIHIDREVISVSVYVFKRGRHKGFKKNEGVLFTFNGQTQGHLTHSFFGNDKVGLSYLKESLLVVVDCSELGPINQDELFMSNRFSLVKSKFQEKVLSHIVEELSKNEKLRELKNKRREEQLKSKLEDQKPLEDVLRNILKKNKVLASIFAMGPRLSIPFKTKDVASEDIIFSGKRFPTFFKFKGKDVNHRLTKNCHRNMRFKLTFETDVEDEYFNREIEPGVFKFYKLIDGKQCDVEDWTGPVLRNGIATVRVSLPANCSINDIIEYGAIITDESRIEPIENYCSIKVQPAILVRPGGKGSRKPPSNKKGNNREKAGSIAFPKIIDVKQHEYCEHDPEFDEYTALRIVNTGEPTHNNGQQMLYDFFVNIDNFYLRSELKASKLDPKVLHARFRFGLVLLGLGMLQNRKKNSSQTNDSNNNLNGDDIEAKIEEFSRATAPILLPMINGLGGLDEKQLVDFADSGEDI
ncbi:MAG: hypothetical protein KAJ07_08830 [Planctomycetes bacterium]|nr:hypothetical protein [Planctomycetota bacterium]